MNNSNYKILKSYSLIIFTKLIYSFTSIFSKLASKESLFSIKFFIYYLIIILILGLYAILWQQVLKKIDLSIAMIFKSLALAISIILVTLLFEEELSLKIIVGIIIIVIGTIIAGLKYEK